MRASACESINHKFFSFFPSEVHSLENREFIIAFF